MRCAVNYRAHIQGSSALAEVGPAHREHFQASGPICSTDQQLLAWQLPATAFMPMSRIHRLHLGLLLGGVPAPDQPKFPRSTPQPTPQHHSIKVRACCKAAPSCGGQACPSQGPGKAEGSSVISASTNSQHHRQSSAYPPKSCFNRQLGRVPSVDA